jgi:hypothetical protein
MLFREEVKPNLRIIRHTEIQNVSNVVVCDGKLYEYYRGDLEN